MGTVNIDKPVDIDDKDICRVLRNKFKESNQSRMKRSNSLKKRRLKRRRR